MPRGGTNSPLDEEVDIGILIGTVAEVDVVLTKQVVVGKPGLSRCGYAAVELGNPPFLCSLCFIYTNTDVRYNNKHFNQMRDTGKVMRGWVELYGISGA